ncbi:MAG TPA: serine hydrolase domain-containing protein [Gemmatimonadaceae bacterium]|nr:serine hydrolase domain-containing protein [Gemmatimonadaceae bacterium]
MNLSAIATPRIFPICPAALLLILAAPAALAQARPEDSALEFRVDSLVRQEANARLLSGVVLLARGDHVLWQRGYGFADWERLVPNKPTTRFGIGSITKNMTDIVVSILEREGRLDLDAPVSKYLGDFPKGPNGGIVTVRHLLNHRSGIPWRVTSETEETQTLHPSDIVDRVRKQGLLFEPGTKELYSSAGYTVLARVIEVVEGKPIEAVLRQRIFVPATMRFSTDESGQQLMPGRALPYRLGATADTLAVFRGPYKDLSFLAGAGSVYATAEDLLHFIRAMRDGVFGDAGRRQVVADSGSTWATWYGRTTNGYEASVDYDPSHDVTFVLLANLQSAATWQLRQQIRNVLSGVAVTAILRPPPVAPRFESPDSVVGFYGDPEDPIVVSLVDGHLIRDGNEFYPIAGRKYYIPANGGVFWFSRTANGGVDGFHTIWSPGRETTAPRITPHRPHPTAAR